LFASRCEWMESMTRQRETPKISSKTYEKGFPTPRCHISFPPSPKSRQLISCCSRRRTSRERLDALASIGPRAAGWRRSRRSELRTIAAAVLSCDCCGTSSGRNARLAGRSYAGFVSCWSRAPRAAGVASGAGCGLGLFVAVEVHSLAVCSWMQKQCTSWHFYRRSWKRSLLCSLCFIATHLFESCILFSSPTNGRPFIQQWP
jgi:hypothetical protein